VGIKTAVVDEQELVRIAVEEILNRASDIDFVGGFASVGTLLESSQEISVVLLGDTLPQSNALASITQLSEAHPDVRIIVLGRQWTVPGIKAVLDCGALGVVDKGEALPDLLVGSVRHVFRGKLFLSPEVAVAYTSSEQGDVVSERELDVIRLMHDGVSTKQIAAALGVKPRTIYRTQEKLCKKWNLRSTGQIVAEAIRRGLLRD
jgi:two-component system secretion response regulator SsrB